MRSARPERSASRCYLHISRVEVWRGCVGSAYLFPTLSVVGASIAEPCPVSTPRPSNRACGFPAHGSRTRTHADNRMTATARDAAWGS